MNRKSTATKPALLASPLNQLLLCIGMGAFIGQVVLALSARHEGSWAGLVCALVFLLAGIGAVTAFLSHTHQMRRGRHSRGPVKTWLWLLSTGLLASLQVGLLAG